MMETVGFICFNRCSVFAPASPSMEVSTRTRTGSKERKMRKASCSLEATVTSKLRWDKCEARYLAMATSSSTISTRVFGFIPTPGGNLPAPCDGSEKYQTGTEVLTGPNKPIDIVLRFHFRVFRCLTGAPLVGFCWKRAKRGLLSPLFARSIMTNVLFEID